ncbi:MAG TPA: polymer-forming cytoskeletal protein [Dongiaceae bacterium]|nr:polymer-forming cytoskeletal protein [Dongiaceae bacterium]
MFGKKKDSDTVTTPTNEPGQDTAARNYLKPEAAAAGVSRPAPNPEIVRRPPDLSAFAPRRADAPAAAPAATTQPAASPAAGTHQTDSKKLIVGRGINLNGEIRTCDSLVVEGTVEAVLSDCRSVELAPTGEFKGSATIEVADISGRFDGELTVNGRLTVRATGKVLGKIRYGQLEIERGGIISGTIEALPETAQAAGINNNS